MPRCYMVKKQINKYQNSTREFWDEGASPAAAPESPTEACVAPSCYNPPSTQPSYLQEFRPNTTTTETAKLTTTKVNTTIDIFRTRSIEETEAAHDLLSLSQSLPPLPAPEAVTIHQTIPKDDESTPHLTYSYSPLSPESASNFRTSPPLPIPYFHQTPIVYVVQVPTVPTPPTSECSSDAENQLLPLCATEGIIKQNSSYLDGVSEKQEDIFILPLSPEPEKQEVIVIDDGGEKTSAKGTIPLKIPDKRMRKNNRVSKNNKNARNNSINVDQHSTPKKLRTTFYTVTEEDEEFEDDPKSGSDTPEADPTKPTRYICSECGKQYATSSNLSRHKQTHRSLDSQSARKCMTCGKAYVSMPALAMHVLTHKLAHSCGICGKQFSRPWLLQGHLRSHSGEKPYGCAHCGKAFADRSNLRAHMQTHSSDKKFRCSNCKKTFALKSYLNKHQESACQTWDEEKGEDVKMVCNVGTNTNN